MLLGLLLDWERMRHARLHHADAAMLSWHGIDMSFAHSSHSSLSAVAAAHVTEDQSMGMLHGVILCHMGCSIRPVYGPAIAVCNTMPKPMRHCRAFQANMLRGSQGQHQMQRLSA